MKKQTVHKILVNLINFITLAYLFTAAAYMVYGFATGGATGFVSSVLTCIAGGFCALIMAVLIACVFAAIWGRDVLR